MIELSQFHKTVRFDIGVAVFVFTVMLAYFPENFLLFLDLKLPISKAQTQHQYKIYWCCI